MSGYVYFIQAMPSRRIKIGFSATPEVRRRALSTSNPETLTLLLTIPGDATDERALHQQFDADRIRGEWFSLSDELVRFISAHVSEQQAAKLLLSSDDAAAILGCRRDWIVDHALELGGVLIARRWKFTRDGLAAYVERQRREQAQDAVPETPAPKRPALALVGLGPINPVTQKPWNHYGSERQAR